MNKIINKIKIFFGCNTKTIILITGEPIEENGKFKYPFRLIMKRKRFFGIVYKQIFYPKLNE
jgi:hypothetical protein